MIYMSSADLLTAERSSFQSRQGSFPDRFARLPPRPISLRRAMPLGGDPNDMARHATFLWRGPSARYITSNPLALQPVRGGSGKPPAIIPSGQTWNFTASLLGTPFFYCAIMAWEADTPSANMKL